MPFFYFIYIVSTLCFLAFSQVVKGEEPEDLFSTFSLPEQPAFLKKEDLVDPARNEKEKVSPLSISTPQSPPSFFKKLSNAFQQKTTWWGYLRNETAFRIVKPRRFDKVLNIFSLEGRYTINHRFQLSGRLRAFYDAVYDLENLEAIHPPKKSVTPQENRMIEVVQKRITLQELYLDTRFRSFDIRIGKQIVRWGVVEGARVTDEINPQDFFELILRDIDDRYIPLFMVRTDIYQGANTFQLIFIPEVRGHRPAPRGTEWEQFRLLPGLVKPEHAWKDFPDKFDNTEVAFRWSRAFSGFEISGSYFYTWDDFPSSFRSIAGFGGAGLIGDESFDPKYSRLSILGGTLSKSFPDFIFNAEASYVEGKNFGGRSLDGGEIRQQNIRRDYFKYAMGADITFMKTDFSPALIQQYILNYDDRIIQDRLDTVLALFAKKEWVNHLWSGSLFVLYFMNDDEWLIRPRTDYKLTDQLRISLGFDLFEGDPGSALPGEFNFIGFFNENDRVFMELNYGF
ncbi:MAG: DUF1302 family protein [Nitrospiria bacterium]